MQDLPQTERRFLNMLFLALAVYLGSNVVIGVPVCEQVCAHVSQPVCGSDHKTYQNLCVLQNADCEARKTGGSITMSYGGSCNSPLKTCNILCDDEIPNDPVCATDAKTYVNQCVFMKAECEAAKHGFGLNILHSGNCTSKDRACPNNCDYHLEPVCSSGNVTYRNPCLLQQAACRFTRPEQNSTRYQLAHNGSCDGSNVFTTFKADCSQYETKGALAPENPDDLLLFRCPHENNPVCTKNILTQTNLCEYCKQMAHLNLLGPGKTVELVHNGACPSYTYSIFG